MELLNKTILDYVSIIILLIVLIYSKTQFSKDEESNKLFTMLVYSLLVFTIFDTLGTYSVAYMKNLPIWVNYAVVSIYFIMEGISIVTFYKYVEKYTNAQISHTVAYYVLSYFPLLFAFECVFANFFIFLLFEFDKYGGAKYGPLFPFFYFILAYYYLMILRMLAKNRKRISKRQRRAVLYFIATSLVMLLIQMVFLPDLPLQTFSFAVATLVLMLTLETPDYQKLKSTLKSLEIAREQTDKLNKIKHLFVGGEDSSMVELEYDFKKCIEDIYNSYRQKAEDLRIDYSLLADDTVPSMVIGNKSILWLILNDYLANTIQYVKHGSIELGYHMEKRQDKKILLSVFVVCSNLILSFNTFRVDLGDTVLEVSRQKDGGYVFTIQMLHSEV